jgi:hypothetical protein
MSGYLQPVDSAHQDHGNMMDALVEKWFTQEEYIAAKAAGAFAWQQPAIADSCSKTFCE